MSYSVAVKTPPSVEPITRAEAKLHLRVDADITDQDALIDALIVAAREWVENYTRRSYVQRTLELRLDCFAPEIKLPRGPVISVTSVKYTDAAGVEQTVDAATYQVDRYSVPPRIVPAFGAVWPTPKPGTLNAVLIEYEAGYEHSAGSPVYADAIPSAVKAAMKLLVSQYYEQREPGEMNFDTVKAVLAPYEIRDFTLE